MTTHDKAIEAIRAALARNPFETTRQQSEYVYDVLVRIGVIRVDGEPRRDPDGAIIICQCRDGALYGSAICPTEGCPLHFKKA